MQVSNNIEQIAISNGINPSGSIKFIQNRPQKDGFVHSNSQTSPLRNRNVGGNYVSVTELYSPKQLLRAYSSPEYVNKLVEQNPNIKNMFSEKGLEVSINPQNVTSIINSHLTTTTGYAMQIANELNISPSDKKVLEKACIFHDFGKILIPEEIINKPQKLTNKEKEVMDMHAKAGYELLSQTGMNKRVLELIKNHHEPVSNNADILGQILSVADIYSALREQRSYKPSMSINESLKILNQKAQDGEVSTEVVSALKKSLSGVSAYSA
ncbi:MAG: HD domain-containing protein [Candidatus Gastranaerophilales bacterium]|nr:HD domain-containing protein [Candidatus Gastranaerophilales bacterium]